MDKLTLKTKCSYACGDLACVLIGHVVGNYFMFYCTNMIGLTLMAVGTMMFLCRIWDAGNDLIIGAMVDRTHTSRGKARPWILWYFIPTAITAFLMFAAPKDMPAMVKLIWVGAAYFAYTWCYTAVNLPYGSMLPLMTKDSRERTALSTFRFVGVYVGMFTVLGGFLPLVSLIGDGLFKGDRTYAYTIMAAVYCALGACFLYVLYHNCREKVYEEQRAEEEKRGITLEAKKKEDQQRGLKQFFVDVSYLVRNKPWLIAFSVLFLTFFRQPFGTQSLNYFYIYYLGIDETQSAFFSFLTLLVGVPVLPFVPRIIGKWGYKLPLAIGLSLTVLASICQFFAERNLSLIITFGALGSLSFTVLGAAGVAMLADSLEYGDLMFDRRLEGIGTAAYSFSSKAAPAFAGLIATAILAAAGLNTALKLGEGAQQSESAITALRVSMFIIPAVLTLLQIILLAFYPLNKEKYAEVVAQLEARNRKRAEKG
ncbi:MAG: glycoside-pentoside-hexuronide (GPH):cation symporter [Spirochaetaceae bacterium]|nr:glycoside-pentoside-hexuronide (GPH):cation symporter [Spirochaetaceae bacterium]